MSARAEASPMRGTFPGAIVAAIVVALGIGAFGGAVVTRMVTDRANESATAVSAPRWDAGKLEAMAGRQLAERFRVAPYAVTAKPVSTRPAVGGWDAGMLEAMQGRQLAERFRTEVTEVRTSLEPGELKAILEGRAFAEEVGAEDPVVKPHVPKRPLSG